MTEGETLRCNIELKARVPHLEPLRRVAEQLGARRVGVLHQVDTYFSCRTGRLKLRETAGELAQLVGYDRPDASAARASHYRLVPIDDAAGLKAVLTAALGVQCVVDKRRELFLLDNVRIHLDEVAGRGSFFELEAVLTDGRTAADGAAQVAALQAAFGIADDDRLAGSYSDL